MNQETLADLTNCAANYIGVDLSEVTDYQFMNDGALEVVSFIDTKGSYRWLVMLKRQCLVYGTSEKEITASEVLAGYIKKSNYTDGNDGVKL